MPWLNEAAFLRKICTTLSTYPQVVSNAVSRIFPSYVPSFSDSLDFRIVWHGKVSDQPKCARTGSLSTSLSTGVESREEPGFRKDRSMARLARSIFQLMAEIRRAGCLPSVGLRHRIKEPSAARKDESQDEPGNGEKDRTASQPLGSCGGAVARAPTRVGSLRFGRALLQYRGYVRF
jgi:hypothetical protein